MSTRDYTPEEIKNKLMDMLISGDKPITIRRNMVKAVRNYILLLERRQKELLNRFVDKCDLCQHNEEYPCNDDIDCDTCPQTGRQCRKCLGEEGAPCFAWRDDL